MSVTESLLADVVARVDIDELATRMVDVFRAEIAAYRGLPADVLRRDIAEISRRNLELFFATLLNGTTLDDSDLRPFRDSARQRAIEGLPLEDLLHAYRRGGQLGWEALVAAAEEGERAALLPAVTRLLEYVDRVSHAVADTYHEEHRTLVSAEERRLRELFAALVAGEPLDAATRETAERQRFPLVDRYRPLAAAAADAAPHGELATNLRARGALAISDGELAIGLIADVPATAFDDLDALVAFGQPADRSGLAGALEDTRLLLDVAARNGARGAVRAESFLPELLLARSPQLAALVRGVALGPLEDYAARRSGDLLATLEVFLASGCERRPAAQRLHVHPNTLDYRLRRIEELTGLSLSRPDDMVLLVLALKQRQLVSAP